MRFLLLVFWCLLLTSATVVRHPANTCVSMPLSDSIDGIFIYELGQSNIGTDPQTGHLNANEWPNYLKVEFSNVQYFDIGLKAGTNVGGFYPYQPGVNAWGYSDQYTYILSKTYKSVYKVKRSVGGTKIAARVGPSAYPRADFASRATLATSLINSMANMGRFHRIVYIDQCESDALNLTDANNYGKNISDLVKWIRDTLNINCQIVIKGISNNAIDFPYRAIVRSKQDSFAANTPNVHLVSADNIRHAGTLTGSGDVGAGDLSHYNLSGCQGLGRKVADTMLSILGMQKDDNIKPNIVSAVIDTSGKLLTVTVNEVLNPSAVPFARQFVIGTKVFSSVTIEANTIKLVPTVPFFAGINYNLRYARDSIFSENIQDLQGNELNAIATYAITNKATRTQPTLTTNYTSNFAGGVDGWVNAIGTTLTGNETSVSGVTGCLKVVCTNSALMSFQKTVSPSFVANATYRIEFNIEVPTTFRYPSTLGFFGTIKFPSAVSRFEYRYVLNRDVMTHMEIEFTPTTSGDIWYIQTAGLPGDAMYIKNVTVKKVG